MRTLAARSVSLLLLLALTPACAPRPGESPAARDEDAPPRLWEGLGGLHHPIRTESELAQRYFDQGLALTYGFNHEAAGRAFEAALEADPRCAMCAWGAALVLGPNINAPMGPEAGRQAYEWVQRALALAEHASERERQYIQALATRYADAQPDDRTPLDRAYAAAMAEVHAADPSDPDAATLYAEALMDLSPWNYWTEDAEPREHTQELLDLLEGVLADHPEHLGANHYYIHAVEEHHPDRAVPSAERLGSLAPDAGHLVHMPSHIFWRVGRYEEALEINRLATASDERFFANCRGSVFYRSLYYPHNVHFLWAAAAAEGRSELALQSARKLEAETTPKVDEAPFVEEFMSIPALTLARFGRWDAVLGIPAPPAERLYLTGVRHYVRGLAHVRGGRAGEARDELERLEGTLANPETEALILGGGVASAHHLLKVAHAHLAGEIAMGLGEVEPGLRALTLAVRLQDEIPYMEPPPFYFPTRQALGAALLEAGLPAEAEEVYRADLAEHPANAWSLFGLAESLRAQDKAEEADWAEQGFHEAWARADLELERSVF